MNPHFHAAWRLLFALLGVVTAASAQTPIPTLMKITSSAFTEGAAIPKTFTGDGKNISPPLHIEGVPAGTKSLVLIVDDPDAPRGTWNHWLIWNIDPQTKDIAEGAVPSGSVQGTSDFGSAKYGGPSPPSGTHRYFFRLYALDSALKLSASTKRSRLDQEIAQHHILAEAKLMGKYSRK
jgi:Raf kinase inhibitor-like YbhB/YbcL family protein